MLFYRVRFSLSIYLAGILLQEEARLGISKAYKRRMPHQSLLIFEAGPTKWKPWTTQSSVTIFMLKMIFSVFEYPERLRTMQSHLLNILFLTQQLNQTHRRMWRLNRRPPEQSLFHGNLVLMETVKSSPILWGLVKMILTIGTLTVRDGPTVRVRYQVLTPMLLLKVFVLLQRTSLGCMQIMRLAKVTQAM